MTEHLDETPRERRLRKQRERYANDPEYRERQKQKARDSIARRKAAGTYKPSKRKRKPRYENNAGNDKRRLTQMTKVHIVEYDGCRYKVKMFTIKYLADALGCSIGTLRKWEQRGVLPHPTYMDSKTGGRLYTESQVNKIVQVVRRYRPKNKADGLVGSLMSEKLHEIWKLEPLGFTP